VNGMSIREGRASDLRDAFGLFERAIQGTAHRMGAAGRDRELVEAEIEENWRLERPLVEFMAAHEGGCFWVAEDESGMVGFARTMLFGRMEQLTEIAVAPDRQGEGLGRELLARCWPEGPTQDVGRLIVAAGSTVDLSLYTEFGTMPATGHWHLTSPRERFLERRSLEATDASEPGVHLLSTDRAVAEWKRLEPLALGHERPLLHEFFGRERTCLATLDGDGQATALCWVAPRGYIGPGVGQRPEDLVPVTLAALDRVAKTQEPEELHLFCTTDAWWLLRRLRSAGFRVLWPSWVMCSEPLPGLDRYVPTRPALVL
jgi:GNAT superfamily N-acetyltransferase